MIFNNNNDFNFNFITYIILYRMFIHTNTYPNTHIYPLSLHWFILLSYPLTGELHGSVQFRTFFEKKLRFHRNSKNEVMRIPRMCSTHKTDFKTSNFYNKIPSRIQIRVAWCLSIYIKFVTFNVHITYNIYISCVYKTNLFMCIMIYFCWNMGILRSLIQW